MTAAPVRMTDAATDRLRTLDLLETVQHEIAAAEPTGEPLELTCLDDALTLRDPASRARGLSVDLLRGRLAHRLRPGAVDHEPLVRVARLSGGSPTRILDATAGLGRDALVLAMAGCHVTAVERSALVTALVRDGLHRATDGGPTALREAIRDRLDWRLGEAQRLMRDPQATGRWEVVSLDPMFAARRKSAAVKQEMQLLQRLLPPADDGEASGLLDAARQCATRRVVVKRARHAAPLGAVAPDFTQPGRSVRFDVYLAD